MVGKLNSYIDKSFVKIFTLKGYE